MLKSMILLTLLGASTQALASMGSPYNIMTPMDCKDVERRHLFSVNFGTEEGAQPLVSRGANGRFQVNSKDKKYISHESKDGRTVVRYRTPIYKTEGYARVPTGEFYENTLEIKENGDLTDLSWFQDPKQPNYFLMSSMPGSRYLGTQVRIARVAGGCVVDQASTRESIGDMERNNIFLDRQYCVKAAEIMNKKGREQVSQCRDLLGDLAKLYSQRAEEIRKSDPQAQFSDQNGIEYLRAARQFDNCAPESYRRHWEAVAMGIVAPDPQPARGATAPLRRSSSRPNTQGPLVDAELPPEQPAGSR